MLTPQNYYRLPWSLTDNGISWLEVTTSCNLACTGCYRPRTEGHKTLEEIADDYEEELDIIKTGSIWYKKADVHDVAVEIVDGVAIVWSRITLTAVVRGNDAVTQFTVTEAYKKQGSDWKLLALTFSSVRDTHQIKH